MGHTFTHLPQQAWDEWDRTAQDAVPHFWSISLKAFPYNHFHRSYSRSFQKSRAFGKGVEEVRSQHSWNTWLIDNSGAYISLKSIAVWSLSWQFFFLSAKGNSQMPSTFVKIFFPFSSPGEMAFSTSNLLLLAFQSLGWLFPYLPQYTRTFLWLLQFWKHAKVVLESFLEVIVTRWLYSTHSHFETK